MKLLCADLSWHGLHRTDLVSDLALLLAAEISSLAEGPWARGHHRGQSRPEMFTAKVQEAELLLSGGGVRGERLQPGAGGWRGAPAVPRPARSIAGLRQSSAPALETMRIPPAPASRAFHPWSNSLSANHNEPQSSCIK